MDHRVENRAPAEWPESFRYAGQRISEVMHIPVKPCHLVMLGLLPLLMGSCASSGRPQPLRAQKILHSWHDDGGSGEVNIRISLPDQIAEFERGGRPIGWCYVATGREGFGTRPGKYRIMEKIEDKYSNRYGWIEDEFGNVVNPDARVGDRVPEGMIYVPAPMPYWMRLTSYGIGMHGGFIPEPGKPASHGCIRLPKQFVPLLYDSVEVGTQVTITNSPSTQGPYFESVPVPRFDGDYRVINSRPVNGPPPGYPGY